MWAGRGIGAGVRRGCFGASYRSKAICGLGCKDNAKHTQATNSRFTCNLDASTLNGGVCTRWYFFQFGLPSRPFGIYAAGYAMPVMPSQAAAKYRQQFPLKPMKRPASNDDEIRQMQAATGMYQLPPSPAPDPKFPRCPSLPNSEAEAPRGRHLWVILAEDFPIALEACEWGADLESQKIKHSNLTGGGSAHSAGEFRFIGDDRIAVNAASGRYGAENKPEFDIIITALRQAGYSVASMEFDIDNPTVANRIFVGDPIWQPPL